MAAGRGLKVEGDMKVTLCGFCKRACTKTFGTQGEVQGEVFTGVELLTTKRVRLHKFYPIINTLFWTGELCHEPFKMNGIHLSC